jgi:hypothetical protein
VYHAKYKHVDISGTKGVNPGEVKLMWFDQTVRTTVVQPCLKIHKNLIRVTSLEIT